VARVDDAVPPQSRAAVQRAARLLRVTAWCHLFTSFPYCCLILSDGFRDDTVRWLLLGAAVCKYLPVAVAGRVSSRLREYRNRRLCLTGGVLVFVSSAWAGLEVYVTTTAVVGQYNRPDDLGLSPVMLVFTAFPLAALVTGLLGGIRTLRMLNDPQVKAVFR
jgi:hypothetical protein